MKVPGKGTERIKLDQRILRERRKLGRQECITPTVVVPGAETLNLDTTDMLGVRDGESSLCIGGLVAASGAL